MASEKVSDGLQLLVVAVLFSAYFLLYQMGVDYGSGGKWIAMFPSLDLIALGVFLSAKLFLRVSWSLATTMACNTFVMPRLAVGAFFGAKDLLHLHWVVAAIFALPPIALCLMMLILPIEARIKQLFGKTTTSSPDAAKQNPG
jgi:hypothetical protein